MFTIHVDPIDIHLHVHVENAAESQAAIQRIQELTAAEVGKTATLNKAIADNTAPAGELKT